MTKLRQRVSRYLGREPTVFVAWRPKYHHVVDKSAQMTRCCVVAIRDEVLFANKSDWRRLLAGKTAGSWFRVGRSVHNRSIIFRPREHAFSARVLTVILVLTMENAHGFG
jgi:hypothetical protein